MGLLNTITPQTSGTEQDGIDGCYHCGLPCEGGVHGYEDKSFCCSGCQTAYRILSENDLCDYYSLDDRLQISTRENAAEKRFAFLDDPEVIDALIDFSGNGKVQLTLSLPGIHCSSCLWLLERLPQIEPAIELARLDFLKKKITIRYVEDRVTLRNVVELLDSLGYPPQLSLEDLQQPARNGTPTLEYLRIGVAGFCFGNMMLLSFPEYLAVMPLAAEFRQFFGYINLVLALPVLLFSARPFFRSALTALRQSAINVDVPLALGILTLFVRSVYDIVSASGPGYLDSFGGLVFLILIGRHFQNKTFDSLRFDRDYRSFLPVAVTALRGGQMQQIPINRIERGDQLLIRHGELIPVDAHLLSGEALLDYSFITGETDPVSIAPNDKIQAGGRQQGGLIEVIALGEVAENRLTELWQSRAFQDTGEQPLSFLTDIASRYFTLSILILAVATAAYWQWTDPSQTLNAFTAVLIIACPCALALAAPFTFGAALRLLARNGFYLRHSQVVEKLAAISLVALDKTGTLTNTATRTASWHSLIDEPALSPAERRAFATLASQSFHPLSRTVMNFLGVEQRESLSDFRETPGYGIEGRVAGHLLKIGSAAFVGHHLELPGKKKNAAAYLSYNGQIRGFLQTESQYRSGIASLLQQLQRRFRLIILSGDTNQELERLQDMVGFENEIHFQQTPQDKLDFVRQCQDAGERVVMVGDGLNDAGALQQADVGIAVAESSAMFHPASDALLVGEEVNKLDRYLQFTRNAVRVLYANLGLSLLYNLIGLWFAVQGKLSPLVCAILMPLSSISVILFSVGMITLAGWLLGIHYTRSERVAAGPEIPVSNDTIAIA